MKLLSWNCRGLGNPRTVLELKDLVSSNKPSCIFLLEVKIARSRVERIKEQLGFQSLFYVNNVNNGGGLALLWKETVEVNLLSYSRFHVDTQVKIERQEPWRLTGFYGHPERAQRRASWNLLRRLYASSSLPWLCWGLQRTSFS